MRCIAAYPVFIGDLAVDLTQRRKDNAEISFARIQAGNAVGKIFAGHSNEKPRPPAPILSIGRHIGSFKAEACCCMSANARSVAVNPLMTPLRAASMMFSSSGIGSKGSDSRAERC